MILVYIEKDSVNMQAFKKLVVALLIYQISHVQCTKTKKYSKKQVDAR